MPYDKCQMSVFHDAYEVYERLHTSDPLAPPQASDVADLLERDGGNASRKEFMNGMNLLHKGLEQRRIDLELARVLVRSNSAALTHADNNGFLPIHHAVNATPHLGPPVEPALIKFLIEKAPETVLETTSNGALPLHLACHYHGGDLEGQLAIVRYLVQLFPESVEYRDDSGHFPLHYALSSDPNILVLRFITQRYPLALQFVTAGTRDLPIHAVLKDQTSRKDEVLSLFVQTCPGTLRLQNSKGFTPLAYACEYDVPLSQIYSLLRAWPEQVGNQANTFTTDKFNGELLPTMLMGDTVSTDVLKQWIRQSPYVIATADVRGRIPLHYAALSSSRWSLDMVKCLFDADPSTLNVADHHGRLALHYAAAAGNSSIVQFMIEVDPLLLTRTDEDGRLVWHYAECARVDEHGELYERTLQQLNQNGHLGDEADDDSTRSLVDSDLVPEEIRWDVLNAQHDWQFRH